MSRATDIGDAVVEGLNGEDFSQDFTAVRMYRPVNELKSLASLTVTVLVPASSYAATSRQISEDTVTVDVLIQKQADPSDLTATDALLDLAEEIADYCRSKSMGNAGWLGSEIVSIYDMEDISEWRLFSALIRLSYKVFYKTG